jgi:hypothetical protein
LLQIAVIDFLHKILKFIHGFDDSMFLAVLERGSGTDNAINEYLQADYTGID